MPMLHKDTNLQVGSNLEYESKVHNGVLWTPSFLYLDPNANKIF